MLGATATQSEGWHWETDAAAPSGEAGHTPTLAAAPEGLSARRVERWLDLPPGAWQKRRLFALRLKGQAFERLGFRSGDLVVVEPGGREQADSVVVTRSASGLSLKKISRAFSHREQIPTVLELPLRERAAARPERVVGTVIGHLRETGTGALRPVGAVHRAASHRAMRATRATQEPASRAGRSRVESVLRTRQRWRDWIDSRRSGAALEELERWERLDASLATLCDCLSRTHNPELRVALLDEATAVVATIHSEMGR